MAFAQSKARNGYVALDIETSGLNPDTDEIIELALAEVNSQGRAALILHHRIRPSKPLSNASESIVGFTNYSLADAPSFHEIAGDIEEAITGKTIVSLNASYDRSFLETALHASERYGLERLNFIDLAEQVPTSVKRTGFDAICDWAVETKESLPLSLGLVTRLFEKLQSEAGTRERKGN